ncbi:MAG TPA: glycerophosphodiester phosphodiesterase [Polyangiaceae bacterium]
MSVWFSAGTLVVGHRGGRGEGWPPENTLPAFEQAVAQGAGAIELDVRTCGTGEIVVHHDPTGATRAQLRARGVPGLDDVLDWARSAGVAVNVELKHDVPSRRLLVDRVGRLLRRTEVDVLLSSFDPVLLAAAAVVAPRFRRALLTSRDQRRRVPRALARLPYVHAIHIERTETAPAVVAGHLGRGLRVGVWTVNDPREARDLEALGVETIISDAAGALLGELTPRR